MNRCKWDRDQETYLRDGEPCKVDDYGDPTVHCTARRSCGNHIGRGELTCARCIGRTRADIRRIVAIAPLMGVQALGSGVNSEALNLAGPAADHEVYEARRAISRGWIYAHITQPARDWCEDPDCQRRHFKTSEGNRWHKRGIENALTDLIPDDDDRHPYSTLTRWEFMLREDYDQRRDDPTSVTEAADYLERVLHVMAQDPEQDWRLFAREMRQCREHLEAVMRNSTTPERGAPCPDCSKKGEVVRMSRRYGHYCDDPVCEQQFHYTTTLDWVTGEVVPDTTGDTWRCPKGHERTHEDYERWVEEREDTSA